MMRADYLSLRRVFEPESIKLVIIAESPPASGRYFYNPAGDTSEPLFSALMQQLCVSPINKENGLREFQRKGWFLIDATYEPVNTLTSSGRDRIISRDYPSLRDDLVTVMIDRSIPIVLLKANVCRTLEPQLIEDGFHVLNDGRVVYFPSTGRQKDFHRQFANILQSAGI